MAHLTRTPAVAAVVAASILFATTGTAQALASRSLGYDLDPLAVGSVRVVAAGALLAAFAAVRGGLGFGARSGFRGYAPAVWGGIGVAAYQLGFFTGVQSAGVAAGTMIALGSGPAFTGALQWVVHRRRPGPVWAVSTVIAVAGMGLIVAGTTEGSDASGVPAGALPALIAGLGYAAYTVAGSSLLTAGASPEAVMGQMFGLGGLFLIPVLVATWPGGLDTGAGAAAAAYLAIVPTVLAYLLFAAGLRRLPPATVATLTLTEPVVAALLGTVVLGEQLTVVAGLGMAAVVASLAVLATSTLRAG
ncbi:MULTISPECIES: DMT family transporter [unclassified Rhodococcus (in: high G+C Gram-positive bacteria)]|uniref:DMT family transporter n=1 Tax=unclassified Rhodococcus (in: high G+C Gram-positive bacteria) TaxID=192944 RepID=UPI00163A2058|nr:MULTISPECIES: EamA family transporter [unclassified Rhodococcus (in: high G+C Gram-positive bacteria)]MBC2638834.1 EamA family transporter [Rhodococcus sp. 3A]MBC2896425.1 EamA family transporter [Rhodococcus sp. 4CII]